MPQPPSDVAIGAPYACANPDPENECDEQNTGAVYIYYGRRNLSGFREQTPYEVGRYPSFLKDISTWIATGSKGEFPWHHILK